jgi:hypothetical protein
MKAFLKRRWILLSCAVALVVCTFVDLPISARENPKSPRMYGLHRGYFFWCVNTLPETADLIDAHYFGTGSSYTAYGVSTEWGIRRPKLGKWPWYDSGPTSFNAIAPVANVPMMYSLGVPIWIPLSVVFGWLVIRELRWREKRAKATAFSNS